MQTLLQDLSVVPDAEWHGRVKSVQGLLLEIAGPVNRMRVGSRIRICEGIHEDVICEIVGFRQERALAMPFGPLDGVRMGARAVIEAGGATVRPSKNWLGRVLNAHGNPIDGKGMLENGLVKYAFRSSPPPASQRKRVGVPIDLGVKALNTFVTCCEGQRMGIFSGSGVGKSVLLSMLARNTAANVSVVGLIGERGREVQEFIEDNLGEDGLARSVVVVATSDEAALLRRQAAYLTLALAEYFRDQGDNVLCMIDSVTRFAMAQREIGLSSGEPPTTRGYPPTVFSELPRLLERAGPGTENGSITGLFTVLVEGDDHNEPIADSVRGILDGHIVMERAIAERGRYPSINVLKSVSRTMPDCLSEEQRQIVVQARQLLATYGDMEELIRLGAYRAGSSEEVDEAIFFNPLLEGFLAQQKGEAVSLQDGFGELARILKESGQRYEAVEGNEQ
ncbi:MAG: flagellar protein export ATPase FliI [Methyloligellaceae bacterium]